MRRSLPRHHVAIYKQACGRMVCYLRGWSLFQGIAAYPFRPTPSSCCPLLLCPECRYALSRERKLFPEERLLFHQERSGPVMKRLKEWLTAQLAEHRTEPNSGL